MHEMDEKDELLGSTTPRHRISRTFQFKIKRSLLAALVLISTCFLLVPILPFPFNYSIKSLTIPRSPNIILPNKHHHPAPSPNSKNALSTLFSQPVSPSQIQHLLFHYQNSFKEGIIQQNLWLRIALMHSLSSRVTRSSTMPMFRNQIG